MIVVQLQGGLGNQMFQYAFGRSLAQKNNCELLLDTSILLNRKTNTITYADYRLSVFNIKARIANSRDIPIYTPKLSIRNVPYRAFHILKIYLSGFKYVRQGTFKFDAKKKDILGNVYLEGYWQSEKYFEDIELILRKEFTFKTELGVLANQMAAQIKSTNAVCIHIRRGDYLKYIDYHGIPGSEYINRAIIILVAKLTNPHFYIFSDEINWCLDNIKLDYPATYITNDNSGTNDIDHFHLMTNCKHFIIANSSFSWWAAWLCNN